MPLTAPRFLRTEYNCGRAAALEAYGPHTVAGLFKTWLSELAEPLLTYSLFSEFMTAMKLDDAQRIAVSIGRIAQEIAERDDN